MNRRQFLAMGASTAAVYVAGCAGTSESTRTAGGTSESTRSAGGTSESTRTAGDTSYPTRNPEVSESASSLEGCAGVTATDGPQSPYDYLALHPVPPYVTEYADSVVVRFSELDAAAERAVRRALEHGGEYRECSVGDTTDVMALFSHVERRWEKTGESFDHTYLRYDGDYYAINIVQEGDFIRVKSIPCTAAACPGTPTPPS